MQYKVKVTENITEFADETSQTNFDDSYQEHVNSVAKKLKISGMKTLKKWKSKHPLTGHEIIGVVVAWSASDMDFGHETKKRLAKEPKKKSSNQYEGDDINSESDGAYEATGSSPDDDDF